MYLSMTSDEALMSRCSWMLHTRAWLSARGANAPQSIRFDVSALHRGWSTTTRCTPKS